MLGLKEDVTLDLIIFDLDDTLVEFKYRYIEAKKSVLHLLETFGISLPSDVTLKPTQDIFDEIASRVKKNGSLNRDEVVMKVNEVITQYEMEAATSTTIFQDAKDVLEALKSMNIKIALVTNNSKRAAEFVLTRFKIKDFLTPL